MSEQITDGVTMQDLSTWTQSKFFSPSFNSAVFDGPLRIYFAQIHESQALKICFGMQQQHENLIAKAKKNLRLRGRNICVLLYPNDETFHLAFEKCNGLITKDRMGDNVVMALKGPFEDLQLPEILNSIATQLEIWEKELARSAEIPLSM